MFLDSISGLKQEISGSLRWRMDARRFGRLLTRWCSSQPVAATSGSSKAGVVVTPWLLTRAPCYAIALGLLLAKKGVRVSFIVDDLSFGNAPRSHKLVLQSINRFLGELQGKYEILRLTDCTPVQATIEPGLAGRIAEAAYLNTIWYMRGDTWADGRDSYEALVEDQLRDRAPHITALLSANPGFDYLVVPGGIYGPSRLWLELANEFGVRVATYDSGFDCLLVSTDGVASQLQDLPRAFESLCAHPGSLDAVLAEAQAEREKRRQGTDNFGYQLTNMTTLEIAAAGAVLIPLNCAWDTAALGLHAVFDNTMQWMIETVRWVLDNTTRDVIVRQHPGERHPLARSKDDYGKVLDETFGQNPRVQFIDAESPVNTYDLLEKVAVVVVYTSTIGVEAASIGKTVITASRSYYSSLGFVFAASSREQYFETLRRGIEGEISMCDAQVRSALCCYYLAQCCNWLFFEFTPFLFRKWVTMSMPDLYNDPKIQDMLTAIDENKPLALIRHQRKYPDLPVRAGC